MSHFRKVNCTWLQLISVTTLIFGILLLGCKEDSEPEPVPPGQSLTIQSPALGMVWTEGQMVTISWASSNLNSDVTLELNRNFPSGTWETMVLGTGNDGGEAWTVSLPATPSARLRIFAVSNPELGDTADYPIAIVSALDRTDALPEDAVKITPATDIFPPVLHSATWSDPTPLAGPINTAGVEDSPVVTPDGQNMFFFFTPDANVAPGLQASDGITGVWWSRKETGVWSEPERIVLFYCDALDSPFHVQDDLLWFGSARAGNYGDLDLYTVPWQGGSWADCANAGAQLNAEYDAGQLCLTRDGTTMYFDRLSASGIPGDYDLWTTVQSGGSWSEPEDLGTPVNTAGAEGQPFLTADGNELWFVRDPSGFGYTGPAIFRSIRSESGWTEPEEIVSNLVGDPMLDDDGNLYFTHIFLDSSFQKVEADIYACYHR